MDYNIKYRNIEERKYTVRVRVGARVIVIVIVIVIVRARVNPRARASLRENEMQNWEHNLGAQLGN
jgi:hypothetical protein